MSFFREQVAKRMGRSSGWSKTRKIHKKEHPYCAVCGKKRGIEVHHIIPFSVDPSLELDPSNLISLCKRHHFLIGHLEYWRSYNQNLHEAIAYHKNQLENRP